MAAYHSADALKAAHARKFGLIERAWRVEHQKLAYDLAKEMRYLVSGTISAKELRRRGHPFGRGRGRVSMTLFSDAGGAPSKRKYRAHKTRPVIPTPLLPINTQTGRLARSLRIIPEGGIGLQSFRLQFTAPEAAFVLARGGTRRMVARGYQTELKRRFAIMNRRTIYNARLKTLHIFYGT